LNIVLIILGVILTVLFFLNVKNAADILCRIIGGFAVLLIYNRFAGVFSLETTGINLISSFIAGILGLPGGILLFCATVLL